MIKFWWEFWWRTIWMCCRWSWISKPWVPEFRHHLVSRCDSRAIHIWFIKCLHHVLFCMKMIFWCYCSNYMYCWLNTTAIVCLAMFRIFCLILVCAAKRWQYSTEWPQQRDAENAIQHEIHKEILILDYLNATSDRLICEYWVTETYLSNSEKEKMLDRQNELYKGDFIQKYMAILNGIKAVNNYQFSLPFVV